MDDLNQTLRTTTVTTLSQLTDLITYGIQQYCSPPSKVAHSATPSCLVMKWHHFRQARLSTTTALIHIFQKWHHFARYSALDKVHVRQVQLHKRQKLDDMMQAAHEAHMHHDSYQLYKIVNRFCPKQKLRRIRLKDDTGNFLTPVEETAEYCRYIADLWCGPQMPVIDLPAPGIPFSLEDLETAISNIPATKAVAPRYAPGVVWKSQAHFLAPWLYEQLQTWWMQSPPFIPQEWRDGWVAFLPKPQKPATKVANLRVLALQEPLGKCVIKLVTKCAMAQSFSSMVKYPQFAFLPSRSTRDALLRVTHHCTTVRALLRSQTKNINRPSQVQPGYACCGGIQVLLDLHKAFDMLPRPLIQQALLRLPLSTSVMSLLMGWHRDTHYHITSNHADRCISVTRGVRQGCCAAPYLWCCLMALTLETLSMKIPFEWLQRCVTIFADDWHIAEVFYDDTTLTQAMTYVGIILDTLTEMGFILNPNKSTVIIRGSGSTFKKWKKHSIVSFQGARCLNIPAAQCTHHIPIAKKSLYLGCIISYDSFEMQTLSVRVAVGWKQFRRLQKWLCGRQRVNRKLRHQIFSTCVIPSILYGIFYTGATPSGIQYLCTQLIAMQRRLIGDMSHITGLSHSLFHDKYSLQHPATLLHGHLQQAFAGLQQSLQHANSDDILHRTSWQALDHFRTYLETFTTRPERLVIDDQVLNCPHCDSRFTHPNLLQKHLTLIHQQPRQALRRIDMSKDSQDGKAICNHCRKSFTTWMSFRYHIQHEICNPSQNDVASPPLGDESDDQVPAHTSSTRELGDRAYAIAQSADYEQAKEDRGLCTYLTQHCVLCNKFMHSSRSYTSHMRHYHQAALQDAISLGLQRSRQYNAMTSPCQFCGIEFTRAHMCVVCTQLAVLEVQHSAAAQEFKCYLCSHVATDRTALKRHLSAVHQFSTFDWKPSRDSLEDQQTCAHCGNTHHCLEALPDIHDHFAQGNLQTIFADADMRRRLTLTCQFCKDSHQTVKHMSHHMYVFHGELAQNADLLCQWLKDFFVQTYGCICNPAVKKLQQTHVCLPFLQLAMLHYQRGDWLFVPIIYTEEVRNTMITHIPINAILHVCDCLRDRQFKQLFQDQRVRDALRTSCFCCGKILTLEGPAHDHNLDFHLRAEHPEPKQAINTLIDMLQEFHSNYSEQKCEWCMADLTTPTTDGDVSSHISECGVVRNLVTWLCSPLLSHGSRKARSTLRGSGADGTRLDKSFRPATETPKRKLTISAFFQRQQCSRHHQDATTDGSASDQARERSGSHAESEQLHSFPTQRTGWDHFRHPEPILRMEEERKAREQVPFKAALAPLHPSADHDQGAKDSAMQEGGPTLGGKHQVSIAAGRSQLALSTVVPSKEDPCGEWQQTCGAHGGYHEGLATVAGTLPDGQYSGQISLPSSSARPGPGDALEAGSGHEKSRDSHDHPTTGSIQPLATGVPADQTTFSAAEQIGGSTSAGPQTEVEEAQLITHACHCLQTITLANNDVECYVNSAFWSVCWVHLMCKQQTIQAWQKIGAPFTTILWGGANQTIDLKTHDAMKAGMGQWHQIRRGGQQDLSEFLVFVLGWMHTTKVSQGFERRYITNDDVTIVEKGGRYFPITLAADLWEELPTPLPFASIIDNWMKQQGMQTALITASPILCWQVCRFARMSHIDSRPLTFGDLAFKVGVFTSPTSLAVAMVSYKMVAALQYSGTSLQGHYRSVVLNHDQWLLFDDNMAPTLHDSIPGWFMNSISHVWMIRQDLYRPFGFDHSDDADKWRQLHMLLRS